MSDDPDALHRRRAGTSDDPHARRAVPGRRRLVGGALGAACAVVLVACGSQAPTGGPGAISGAGGDERTPTGTSGGGATGDGGRAGTGGPATDRGPGPDGARPGPTLSVSPAGDDAADGSPRAPLRTVGAAIERIPPGGTIRLAAGRYPAVHAERRFARRVTIVGPPADGRGTAGGETGGDRGPADGRGTSAGAPRATIVGATLEGAANLAFRDVAFDATVTLTVPASDLARETSSIAFDRTRFSTADARTSCLELRNGTHHVAVRSSVLERCFDGIATAGVPSRSGRPVRHVLVRGNTLRRMRSDGLNLAYWSDAEISGNTIQGLRDPAGRIHNDAIQIMGGSARIRIVDNRLLDSATQLLLVEPTIGGPVRDLTVENNLLVGAGAAAVQMLDTPGLRFVGNTVAASRYHSLMLRHVAGQPATPPDAGSVVANNVLADGLAREPQAAVRVLAPNAIAGPGATPGSRPPTMQGAGARTRVAAGSAPTRAADRTRWRHRPRTGPAARTMGYVPREDWR